MMLFMVDNVDKKRFFDELLWTMYCLFKAVYIVFPEFIGFLALIFGCALGCLVLP